MSSSKPVHNLLTLTGLALGAVLSQRAIGFDNAQASVRGQKVKGIAVSAASEGEAFPISVGGTEILETGAAVAVGDDLITDTQGRGIPAQGVVSVAVTGITVANPGVVTAANHGLATGDIVTFNGVGGMTQVNGRTYVVTAIDANTFSIGTTVGNDAFTAGGTVAKVGPDGSGGHRFARALEAASGAGKFIEVLYIK